MSAPTRGPADPSASPRDRMRALVLEWDEESVASWCADVLAERVAADQPDRPPLRWLGGRHAADITQRGLTEHPQHAYWLRVWGARGLLYAWSDAVAADVVAALRDESWRVREMACRVIRARQVDAADSLLPVLKDPVPRVRVAALRAAAVVGEVEALDAAHAALDDPEPSVRRAAERAVDALATRLDRAESCHLAEPTRGRGRH